MMQALPGLLHLIAWLVALGWLWKTAAAALGLPKVPNLLLPNYDRIPEGQPWLTVIVPARDEGANIHACLQSLMEQDYPNLHVIAINDRSRDLTGILMEQTALLYPGRLTVLNVTDLPEGWLGKTHALALGAREAAVLLQPEFLLFTDADVMFRPDALRRTLVHAVETKADHIVTMPTLVILRWDEALLMGFFQIFALWVARPWKVADPKAIRDAVGVGAFNMMRRSAYLKIGGFEGQKMDILEDLTLARRVKNTGLRQRVAFGLGLAEVHWAPGAWGLIGVMTKNVFAGFRFHISLLLLACGWLTVFAVAPAFEVFYEPTRLPAWLTVAAVFWGYWIYGKRSGISTWTAAFFPVAAAMFIFALLRSMTITLRHGGVRWRGTFYALKELRERSMPLREK